MENQTQTEVPHESFTQNKFKLVDGEDRLDAISVRRDSILIARYCCTLRKFTLQRFTNVAYATKSSYKKGPGIRTC